ncbi:plant UBX domain-containing protein 7 isoform X2 [Euphorbia lathyris]|uniref:plant UBX domain-containing protein 7 isoform X2 n=1 Tax=Euphorbia lathyris TaxID=212925 RepID=UPI003314034C
MDEVLSANDQQSMVSSFLEIAVGQTADTARQFLQATSWKLEEALQLFYIGNEVGQVAPASQPPPSENAYPFPDVNSIANELQNENGNVGQDAGDGEVRAPLPVVRETLYDDAMFYRASRMGYPPQESSSLIAFRNFDEEMKRPAVWEAEQGATSTADTSRDNLASLYRPPFHLMFHGSFEKAKGTASVQDKWLLVNIQSTKEFSSHMLNRDTWANEAVGQTVSTNFIFWQVYDDASEGRKVCTYYKLDSIPVVLVIDPITGQKMRAWSGMVHPESLLEDLVPYMDGGPRDHHVSHKRLRGSSQAPQKNKVETNKEDEDVQRALAASMEGMKDLNRTASDSAGSSNADKEEETCTPEKPTYPLLPEEPRGDKSLICRVGLRFPDGRRMQRNFLKTDPIQLLWSFCYSEVEKTGARPFRLTQAIPGAKSLDYGTNLTFGESGLANTMISVAWE